MAERCDYELRTGRCVMDAGHRGRHTTAAYWCDACNTWRRGSTPYRVALDGNGDPDVALCWFCCHVLGPEEERRLREDLYY